MKKGIVIPITGIVLFLISAFVLWLLTKGGGAQENINILRGELATSFTNEIQFYRKTVDEATKPIGEQAAYLEGQNEVLWDISKPTLSDAENSLSNRISLILPSGIKNGNFEGRTLNFLDKNIIIDPCEPSNLLNSKCFKVSGTQRIVFADSNIDGKADVNIVLDQTAASSYFKLFQIGRKLFENEKYKILKSRVAFTQGDIKTPNSRFDVKTVSGAPQTGCSFQSIAEGSDPGDGFYYIPVQNLIKTVFDCGLTNKNGRLAGATFSDVGDEFENVLEVFYPGINFEINPVGGDAEFMIEDKSCLPRGDYDCIVYNPSTAIIDNFGRTIKYDYLKLKFLAALTTPS